MSFPPHNETETRSENLSNIGFGGSFNKNRLYAKVSLERRGMLLNPTRRSISGSVTGPFSRGYNPSPLRGFKFQLKTLPVEKPSFY